MPVNMYKTIFKHIMLRCHCTVFCRIFHFLRLFLADVGIASICAREGFKAQHFRLLYEHHVLACTPKDPPRRVNKNEMSFRNIDGTIY